MDGLVICDACPRRVLSPIQRLRAQQGNFAKIETAFGGEDVVVVSELSVPEPVSARVEFGCVGEAGIVQG